MSRFGRGLPAVAMALGVASAKASLCGGGRRQSPVDMTIKDGWLSRIARDAKAV